MILRNSLLFLSRQKQLRRWMETSSISSKLTKRFVAGQTLDGGLAVCRKLNRERILGTLDHLGENVTSLDEARASRDACLLAVRRIAEGRIDSTVSIKLTQFGMDLSPKECERNVADLVETAKSLDSYVEMDMESSEYVDGTLDIVTRLHQRFQAVRSVIQAYLYRSEEDIRRLSDLGIPIRLCKGAYQEPASVAFPDKAKVDENYKRLTHLLMEKGVRPAIATHDPSMIQAAIASAKQFGRQPDQFEFQMLYGVRRDLQNQLVSFGYQLRLYVPYGDAWYPYFMRRLAERPANVWFLARALLSR
jgi:proline dehydrogenase